jgi:YHS domain-containing protein
VWRALLLLILFILIARALWRLFSGIAEGAAGPGPQQRRQAPPALKMAQDPICGTYVVPGKALELMRGRETMYFCSDKCRDEWVSRGH